MKARFIMAKYVLSCCSTADLSQEHFSRRDINYICFHFFVDGKEYVDDLGKSFPFRDFYAAMANGAQTSTTQVNVDEYITSFTPLLEQGLDILHLCLSSGLSGTYNSASAARDVLIELFPDRKIYIVDSLAASSGFGLLMDKLADLRDSGMDLDELAEWTDANKLELHHWFFSTDLSYYVKGGRISKASGWFGTMLHICPLLNVDDTGHLIPRQKIRGKRKVKEEIVEKMKLHASGGLNYSGKCFLSHSDCYDDARDVADQIEAIFPKLDGKVEIFSIGTTIGSHTGPGTVALFFWGDNRQA